jgi:hypothetical protein
MYKNFSSHPYVLHVPSSPSAWFDHSKMPVTWLRPIIAEALFRSHANLCGICGKYSMNGPGCSQSTSDCPSQYLSTIVPHCCSVRPPATLNKVSSCQRR